MTQPLASPSASETSSRKRFWRGATLGVVVGVVATLVIVGLAWGANQVLSDGARTFTTTCNGAHVTGTIWEQDSVVFTSVSVVDPKVRTWTVRWADYAGEVPGGAMVPIDADYTGSFVTASQALGDTDGGTHRTAQVRPKGQSAWCALDMHISLIW